MNNNLFLKQAISVVLGWAIFAIISVSLVNAEEQKVDTKKPPTIVVLGDSLSAGYQLEPGQGYPDRLEKSLAENGVNARIVGAGVSGDTTSGGLSRIAWSVPENTDAVILELGANDALRGLPPEKTEGNLEAIITQLLERDIKVLLIGMLAPPNMGDEYENAFNPIYSRLAEKHGLRLYPFFLEGVMTHPDLLLADGMHPNAEGVDIMVEKTRPMVENLIEELRPTP